MKSEVYFARLSSDNPEARVSLLKKLLEFIGPFRSYKKDELVPVKLTIGESNCVYHLSPELVKIIVLKIIDQGARPFLFDTSVIYQGQRQNAVDHLALAEKKGFGYAGVGAPFIVADGLLGLDGREFNIEASHIKKVRIPSFIGMLDSLVVLSHITGHILSGYAGAIKNVAMGMSCRSTKLVQHASVKPSVVAKKCTACGCCIAVCPVRAISYKEKRASISNKICIGCGECLCACKFDAIPVDWGESPEIFSKKMAEVAHFILPKFKDKFFINFALDITKECDCLSTKDDKMVSGNIGILASSDIVSLDKATADLANQNKKSDFFSEAKDRYEPMLEYAARIGLGSLEYALIEA